MKEKINSPKRPQSLGEEIGNSITHGVGFLVALVGIIFGIAMMVVKSDAGGLSAIPMVNYFADAGIAAIIVGPMYGLFMLALFHVFAELLTVLVDIARNTKK